MTEGGGERSQRASIFDRILAEIASRAVRSRPAWLLPIPRVLVFAAWVCSLVLAWITLLPFRFPAMDTGTIDVAPLVLDAPGWFRVVVVVAIGVLASALSTVLLLRRALSEDAGRRSAITDSVFAVVLGAGAVVPVAGSLRAGLTLVAVLCASAAFVGAVVTLIAIARRATSSAWLAVAAIATGLPWWMSAPTLASGSVGGQAMWVTLSVVVMSAVLVAAFIGLSSAALRRTEFVRDTLRFRRSRLLITIVLLVVAVILVLRLTIAHDLFTAFDAGAGAADEAIWVIRSWTTWPLSALVAVLIVFFAIRSETRPRRPFGIRAITLVLTAGFSVAGAALIITSIDELIAPMAGRPVVDLSIAADGFSWMLVAASVALVIFIVLPMFRGTAARWIAIVGVVYLVPGTVAAPLVEWWPEVPTFWAAPVTVVVAITVCVAVIVIGQWFGAFANVSRSTLLRLLVYPVVVLHATTAVPAALGGGAATVIGVALLAIGVIFLLPRVAADRVRHSHTVLMAAATTLFALLGLVLAARSEAWLGTTTVLALLMLAVPVIAGLTIRTSAEPTASAPSRTAPAELGSALG